jgi:NhaP-type Na+/H+ or K+/H+ antiporter
VSPENIVLVGAVVFAYAMISRRARSWPVSMPMIFVGLGALMALTGALELDADVALVRLTAEAALAVILFSDAVRIDLRALRRNALLPTRLLLVGLPLTIVLAIGGNALLFPGIAFAQIALIAAILAPTDAALGAAVVEDERVPLRERLSLNVESGLNDGLVVPVVAIFTTIALEGETSGAEAMRTIIEELGFGLLVGVVVGVVAVSLLFHAHVNDLSEGRYEQIGVFVLPIIAYAGAQPLHGSGFISAFVAGLLFGSLGNSGFEFGWLKRLNLQRGESAKPASEYGEFTEDAAQLLSIGAFFLFGNLFVGERIGTYTWQVWVCALLSLTVYRMLPVWLSYTASGRAWQTRLFVGWFGPRGLASIVFGILLLEDAAEFGRDFSDLFGVITLTVTASVVLHGLSAAWGARSYGRWAEHAGMADDQRSEMFMTDMDVSMAPPARWSPRED